MNYFEKKQWIRLAICAVVVLAITLLVSGLIGDSLKYNLKEEPEKVSEGDYQYSSVQETNFSKITVYANAEDGKITECKIVSEDKGGDGNDLLTDAIRDEWAKAIVETGSADADAITGATLKFSAEGVKAAVNDILAQIGGGVAEPAEPEETNEPQTESGNNTEYAYSSEQETNFSKITVYANAEDGKITECKIVSEDKGGDGNDLLTDAIRDEWAKAIVETGNADADAITGATLKFSAEGVKAAVNDILARIGGGTANAEDGKDEGQKEETARESTGKQVSEVDVDSSRVLYGSYTARKETNFSIIRVTINTKGGQITGCKITSEAKSEGSDFLTSEIKDAWAKAIVENGTADTDAITGATLTYSSAAVIDAVNEILAQIH